MKILKKAVNKKPKGKKSTYEEPLRKVLVKNLYIELSMFKAWKDKFVNSTLEQKILFLQQEYFKYYGLSCWDELNGFDPVFNELATGSLIQL